MPVDVLRFRRVFGFLEQFLHSWNPASFLRLFDPVAYKDVEVPLLIERRMLFYSREPTTANGFQRPGGGPKKMDHGRVAARRKSQVTNNGGNTKFI